MKGTIRYKYYGGAFSHYQATFEPTEGYNHASVQVLSDVSFAAARTDLIQVIKDTPADEAVDL